MLRLGWSALTVVLGLRAKGFQLKVAAGEQRRARRGQLCCDGGNNYFMYTDYTVCVFASVCVCVCVCIRQIINRRGRSCSNYTSAQFIPPLPRRMVPVVCADG